MRYVIILYGNILCHKYPFQSNCCTLFRTIGIISLHICTQLGFSYLAADGFGESICKLDNTYPLIFSEFVIGIILYFLFKLLGGRISSGEDDYCFDRLTSERIGDADNAAFHNGRVLRQNVFHLIRTDTEPAGFYNVIEAAVEPVQTVFVLPGGIARMVNTAAPDIAVLLLVIEISAENAGLSAILRRYDDDLANLADGRFFRRFYCAAQCYKMGKWFPSSPLRGRCP